MQRATVFRIVVSCLFCICLFSAFPATAAPSPEGDLDPTVEQDYVLPDPAKPEDPPPLHPGKPVRS